jgi:hypothetical protein
MIWTHYSSWLGTGCTYSIADVELSALSGINGCEQLSECIERDRIIPSLHVACAIEIFSAGLPCRAGYPHMHQQCYASRSGPYS